MREIGFLTFLLTTAVVTEIARRRRLAPARAGMLVPIASILIAIGVAAGLVVREELDWFFVVAGPGLVLSAIGYVTWAVWAGRAQLFPVWAAVLLGVGGLTAIVMSECSGSTSPTGPAPARPRTSPATAPVDRRIAVAVRSGGRRDGDEPRSATMGG